MVTRRPAFHSLRARFVLVVLCVVLVPLTMLGWWLNRGTTTSGTRLLHDRLDSTLSAMAWTAGSRWVRERSALLAVAEADQLRGVLVAERWNRDVVLGPLQGELVQFRAQLEGAVVRDSGGVSRWSFVVEDSDVVRLVPMAGQPARADTSQNGMTVALPVYGGSGGRTIGWLEVTLRAGDIMPANSVTPVAAGAVMAIMNPATGVSLVAVPFDPALLTESRFTWAGSRWLTARRLLQDPPVMLLAAAPLDPFVAPFSHAARLGAWALLATTALAFLAALLLARRLTRSLEELAGAADAVSAGDLSLRIEPTSADEVGRVAQAFNAMTESLRRTLKQLSERQAIAAVGEFASTLAHEIRNPLGAMRLNLQSLETELKDAPAARQRMHKALADVDRLESTVAGALQVARSGRVTLESMDVRQPVAQAVASARPAFVKKNVALEPPEQGSDPVRVKGDRNALERLFLNLLLNAAQATESGRRAGIRIESDARHVFVSVWDEGAGIRAADRARIFDAFYSTRPEGTGLGLAVARQIVAAHGGELEVESEAGLGTTFRVILGHAM